MSFRDRELERLRNIVRMHMMNGFHTEIRKEDFVTVREILEHRQIKVSRRVKWRPAGANKVTRVKNRSPDYFLARRIQQPLLNRCLFYPIAPERVAGL